MNAILEELAAELYRLEWDANLYDTPRGEATRLYESRAARLIMKGWKSPGEFSGLDFANEILAEEVDKHQRRAREFEGKWKATWELAQNRAKEIFKLQRELAEVKEEVRCLRAGGEY